MQYRSLAAIFVFFFCSGSCSFSLAQPLEPLYSLARKEKPALIETMRELVSIESGSGDREGLDRLASLIAERLKGPGGAVELLEAGDDAYRMFDTPERIGRMVLARFQGTGRKKILLIAHMDTVYLKGMLAQQPFRVDGERAYGLGISDDKQGVALIIHTVALLRAMGFRDYGTLTVLINGDEEISSPGARAMLTRLGAENDAVFSCEASRADSDRLSLATSGIGSVTLKVKGRASHAGSAPELGRNALYELSHQVLQLRDLSKPEAGFKMNWTLSKAGTNRNVIPAEAAATADVRMLRQADFAAAKKIIGERVKKKLIPDTQIELSFEDRRPPLEESAASKALGAHAQLIYRELGKDLAVVNVAEGGGTDAAFAALKTRAPVLERFGLQGFGAHSNDAEYVDLNSIEPRLYLLARMIMDVSRDKAPAK
jgi:glutamate carboxypeptidase